MFEMLPRCIDMIAQDEQPGQPAFQSGPNMK